MNLLDMISNRGDIPSQNQPQQAIMPPGRGQMPWSSGFEGHHQSALMELMEVLKQRQQLQKQMAQRHQQVPVAGRDRR